MMRLHIEGARFQAAETRSWRLYMTNYSNLLPVNTRLRNYFTILLFYHSTI